MKIIRIVAGAVAAAVGIAAPAANATGDDGGATGGAISDAAVTVPLGTGSGNQYDPAVVPYSSDPTNMFAPVYTVKPIGPEDVTATDPSTGEVDGTQAFGLYSLGFPADTFSGDVQYTPTAFTQATGLSGILSELSRQLGFNGGYNEEIFTNGAAGTLLPGSTGFLISEFGFGYGNVFEDSYNGPISTATSQTVGDFILTPYGDINVSPIADFFAPPDV